MSRSNQLPNLEKLFKDDDEQDFTPLGGSNLAAIFGTSNKQPETNPAPNVKKKTSVPKSTPQRSASNKTEVILAKAVHAYKLQNGQYTLIGKVGIALTGNVSAKTYLLILYRNNNEHISVVTLTSDFKFSIQENNYASYYDGNNDNWSILFDNKESSVDFTREMGLAKYFIRQGTDDAIFYQDLTVCSKGSEAKEGDNVSLKYSIIASINQPLKMSSIPVQTMVTQISTDDNWERSLLGVTKGLKRILILPPSKQISLGPGFPRDKEIALDIEVTDVVQADIKRTPSSQQITSTGKASLITRMAKMGQSMLPKKSLSTTTDSEDTEDEFQIKSPRRLKRSLTETAPMTSADVQSDRAPAEPRENLVQAPANIVLQRNFIPPTNPSPHGTLVATGAFSPVWPTASVPQQYVSTVDGQLYSFPTSVPQPVIPSAMDPNINVFLSETRTHNAEIRMGMSKIADNVQKLLDKFHLLEVQNATPNSEKALETSLKMLLTLNNKTDGKNFEALDIEKNSPINDRELNLEKARVKALEESLTKTNHSLTKTLDALEKIEAKKNNFDKEKSEMTIKIEKLESSLSDARDELQKSLLERKTANDHAIQCQKECAKLEAKIITVDAENKALSNTAEFNVKNSASEADRSAEIKQIMNKMYQTLISRFTEGSYRADYIKTTIANTIRSITLQCLKERSDQESSDDAEINVTESNKTKMVEDLKTIEADDKKIFLPNLDKSLDLIIDASSGAQEPPPIPPMDLDIDSFSFPF